MQKIKMLFSFILFICALLLIPISVFAHAVVKPNQVGVATFQTFTLGVPNEKDNPAIAVRLMIPEGLKYVSPNVKPGWKIDIKKSGEGEDATVTEIDWTEGSIPAGQRDDFLLSAQVPANETTINWNAYQTYQNGEVISWDVDPNNPDAKDPEALEKTGKGPSSQTKIVNDLSPKPESQEMLDGNKDSNLPLLLSAIAIIVSGFSLGLTLRRK